MAHGASDSNLIPELYLPTTWSGCISPACFSDYRPRPMEIFLRSVWGYRLQQLLCCKIRFTHFKQNARTAVPKQIRWRGDQNPSFLFLIPYWVAAGSWNDCCCMLKADPHRAANYFHAPCEVRRLEDSLKKNQISTFPIWENYVRGVMSRLILIKSVF